MINIYCILPHITTFSSNVFKWSIKYCIQMKMSPRHRRGSVYPTEWKAMEPGWGSMQRVSSQPQRCRCRGVFVARVWGDALPLIKKECDTLKPCRRECIQWSFRSGSLWINSESLHSLLVYSECEVHNNDRKMGSGFNLRLTITKQSTRVSLEVISVRTVNITYCKH